MSPIVFVLAALNSLIGLIYGLMGKYDRACYHMLICLVTLKFSED